MSPEYAELHAHSCYSFLHGADQPPHLIDTALKLGLTGIALIDYDGVYGAVQTAQAAKNTPLKTVFGTELTLNDPTYGLTHLPVLANNLNGYHQICKLISTKQLHHTEKPATSSPGRT
ncbi:putative error-prone DNA polymerase [Gleimia coleocanis DSM 15436]|uniref:Putative error-prone DNA polymerase n=1 Tax=Gleimia coleocanis DSM 15436 TaxID=525245 RepID=C0W0J5_9ACTO|nr:PHP domain-containing protein [Gleimia coleocanis]EEH64054.1 putative error-prone DNA polymerase [Gleimia coleocanis DSM 15436]